MYVDFQERGLDGAGRDVDEYKRASARTFRHILMNCTLLLTLTGLHSGCLIPCLRFLVISVTFAVFNVVIWFCPCFVLFGFALSPIQSRTNLFCYVFQNNKKFIIIDLLQKL